MKMLKVKDVRPLFGNCLLRIYRHEENGYGEAIKLWEGTPEEITPFEDYEINNISGAYEAGDNPYWNIFAIVII